MEGFTKIFNSSIDIFQTLPSEQMIPIFQSFRLQKALFWFIENGDTPPDEEAIRIAKDINDPLYDFYLQELKDRKLIGYGNSVPTFGAYNNCDSRHVMMSVILFHYITEPIHNILEIGGGYANWLYLNRHQPFTHWTIIDLPHIGKLQEWCLKELQVDPNMYDIVSAFDYEKCIQQKYDVVIGAHSLSEFSFDIFCDYFYKIVKNTKYFLYCYHNTSPNKELIDKKRALVDEYFTLEHISVSENGNVSNCLFRNKSG